MYIFTRYKSDDLKEKCVRKMQVADILLQDMIRVKLPMFLGCDDRCRSREIMCIHATGNQMGLFSSPCQTAHTSGESCCCVLMMRSRTLFSP